MYVLKLHRLSLRYTKYSCGLRHRGQQYELLDWLDKVTFPMEARFADVKFARETYTSVVRRVIDCGVNYLLSNDP
jgi:cytosine/adenosine deaminase-related metal-dependent hydrolase